MCKWSSIQLSLLSPKSSLERSLRRASADWNDLMLKLSSPCIKCWHINIFVCWQNDWTFWKSCAYWIGCDGFLCSEYMRSLLYNPVVLPYALHPAFSTPTTCLWALVFVGSGVHVRSDFWGSIVSSFGVSSGGSAPGTLSMGRWIGWLSWSMAIQVHWPKSNHNGSGWLQPAGG